jgi:hypothetical protein
VGGRLDAAEQPSLVAALGSVGGRLDAADAAKAATDLRARLERLDRLDRPNLDDVFTQWSLIAALGSVGGRLDAADAAKATTDLIARLDRPNLDDNSADPLIAGAGQAFAQPVRARAHPPQASERSRGSAVIGPAGLATLRSLATRERSARHRQPR